MTSSALDVRDGQRRLDRDGTVWWHIPGEENQHPLWCSADKPTCTLPVLEAMYGPTLPLPEATVAAIQELLAAYRYRFAHEKGLQEGIGDVLETGRFSYEREVYLGSVADRIDFLVEPEWLGLGIEVKVAGDPASVVRQLTRYAASPAIRQLLLVTTRHTHRGCIPPELEGKRVSTLLLRSAL